MAVTCLSKETQPEFLRRVEKLSPDSPPQFGKMNVVEMMRHLRNALETALGETDLPNDFKPIRGRLMHFLATRVMTTWPKGKIVAPDYWVPTPEHDYQEERRLFISSIERFVDAHAADGNKVVMHPMFGPLSMKQWSRLSGIHVDHHLQQFGT